MRPYDRRDKAVPVARQGFDEAWMLGVVAQRFAQSVHRRVDAVFEVNDDTVWPESLLEFLAGDYLTWMLKQKGQNLERLVLQPHLGARLAQFSCSKVNFEDVETRDTWGAGRMVQGETPPPLTHHIHLGEQNVNDRNHQGDTMSSRAGVLPLPFVA